ncbi:MAG: pyruvate, phosphate dikinase [candidate division Zixibacteria bacterium]|nr:pyruvate, phosphate dikinase [candidate division Zixibacteria bacterium]
MVATKTKAKTTKKAAKKAVKKKAAAKPKAAAKKVVKKAPNKKVTTKKTKTKAPVVKAEPKVKVGKIVYLFGGKKAEGKGDMKDLLGGKGAGLAEMTNIGIPVPPGFTITTETCNLFYQNEMIPPEELAPQVAVGIKHVEKLTKKKFGDPKEPLLLSVRSGAKFSMPGMMDTVLNLGLNDETIEGLISKTENDRFVYDSYRRFVQMFGNVVLAIDKSEFEHVMELRKKRQKIKLDTEMTVDDLKYIIKKFKRIVKDKTGEDFPQDVNLQLEMSRDAVFRSWNNPRAITYRKLNNIPGNLGTAINIQAMVFGNMGEDSATGVGFTRDPSTGQKEFYGEYLTNAQGEDVVAGIRTPKNITDLAKEMPKVYKQLREITTKLEKHYRDIQDFEFTIQEGILYMLQTRTGKRTTASAVKIAVDMVKEKLITKKEALLRVEPESLEQLLHPRIDPNAKPSIIAHGLAASPGASSGMAVFSSDDAVRYADAGKKVILIRQETNPDDIHGMNVAEGILTARGGMTSHAAVVARGMGKCCVAGAEEIKVYEVDRKFIAGKTVISEGDVITLNGTKGEVMTGEVATIEPELSGEFGIFMGWADEVRKLKIRTNADTPGDSRVARSFGAEGIGLCRTEHMFFAPERIPIVQQMILAHNELDRRDALDKLLPYQKKDFKGIFEAMQGLPVTIRTIDPPLHEFLPDKEEVLKEIESLKAAGAWEDDIKEKQRVLARIEELTEFNPMMGHRGCRLGITYPEITEMQTRAIFMAACAIAKKPSKTAPIPEIMIPLVGTVEEFKHQRNIVIQVAEEVMRQTKTQIDYLVGTMIEIPRGALTADEIAEFAEFFSFGTNDLTQMAYGYSRDDATRFIKIYMDKGILPNDPFVSIDRPGVGQLMKIAVEKGRSVKKDIKLGICGEHGGDPNSIEFCHQLGLDYVSCSPYRVPIARLAAAHAVLGATEYTMK